MKILLLGAGMQGRAAIHDLAASREVVEIVAADRDYKGLEAYLSAKGLAGRVRAARLDAGDPGSVEPLMAEKPAAAISLLPPPYHGSAAAAAVRHGVHLVTASYAGPGLKTLDARARDGGVAILPECGMDPGIDLILLGHAIRSLDSVHEVVTYGAGFPEPAAAQNALRYKAAWNLEGVLKSYARPARVIRGGLAHVISAREIFAPANIHTVEIDGLGSLEAYPNGDALKYAALLGLDPGRLARMERCVLRWPGHAAFWKTMADLHLLDDVPVMVNGLAVDRKRFLAAALEPHLRYRDGERDVVVVRVAAAGTRKRRKTLALFELIDRRDPVSGLTAMARTVGFTASICAQMLAAGGIAGRGLLSPARDVPFEPFIRELAARGIAVTGGLRPAAPAGPKARRSGARKTPRRL